jgi:regulation of enolase protein 1 (concanavalin A-like superfamily)
MKVCFDKSEEAALRLSAAARAVLVRTTFDGHAWSLRLPPCDATAELVAAKAARETADGIALTITGMSLRAICVRLAHRHPPSPRIAPERRS